MAKIFVLANQKGGVGKTTTAVNLGASLAAAEKRVLCVDMDPQGNLSSGLGHPKESIKTQAYDVLVGRASLEQATLGTALPSLHVVPSTTELIGAEVELVDEADRHLRLRQALEASKAEYDFVLIDCPPALGLLTLNSLVAAEAVLVPMQCEYYALEGLSHLVTTIDRVRASLNPGLRFEGIILCMYDKRMNLTRQVESEVRQHFPAKVFDTVIPRNVRLGEAPSFGKPVLLYDVDSAGARSYLQLAQELLKRGRRSMAGRTIAGRKETAQHTASLER